MYVTELSEPQLLVVYPGRFQPFHKGHHAVYNYLATKYGRNNVYIATSNKVETPKSPFSFAEKAYFMQLTGVPSDRIVQASSPYNIQTVIAGGNIHVADPANTVVIFAVSEKDMAEDPRFQTFTKKDGTPAYLQKMPKNIKETEGMNRHAYIMTVPTFNFNVLGEPMRSGTELRGMYVAADEPTRQAIIKDLFGKYTAEAEQLMTSRLAPAAPVAPPRPTKLPKTVKPEGLQEEASKTDPKRVQLLNKARIAHPFAKSDEEALALYINDKEVQDVDNLENELGSVESEEHSLETIVDKLEQKFTQLNQKIDSIAQQPVSEVRIVDPKFVDLFYSPANRNLKTMLIAQHVPADKLDQIINTLVQKRNAREDHFTWKPSEGEEKFGRIAEMGGVGVVKGGNDPRYCMATAGDQNDVNGDTLGKEMKALGLTRKPPKTGQQPVKGGIGRGLK